MPFSRARYVALCQRSLILAAVVSVGVSAARVRTLDIVPQPGDVAGARDAAPGRAPQSVLPHSDRSGAA